MSGAGRRFRFPSTTRSQKTFQRSIGKLLAPFLTTWPSEKPACRAWLNVMNLGSVSPRARMQ